MELERAFDVLVVGAGPAGLAAASTAAAQGARVGVVDDNHAPGGQIWRGEASSAHPDVQASRWLEIANEPAVELVCGARVIFQPHSGELLAETHDERLRLGCRQLILAPGARELFLPFPGWTLPNVLGAGGLQALVKSGLAIKRMRVVVAGSGPLLLAVAAYLRKKGADVRLVAEQASIGNVLGFGFGLATAPAKLTQALKLKRSLGPVRYATGCWPLSARGEGRVEAVTLTDGRRTWEVTCDYLACGFGLVPNTELPRMLGCAVGPSGVVVDGLQRTTVERTYCVGEATGIGGLEKSLVEGKIAGYAATGRIDEARRLFGERERALKFARALDRAFALRSELKALAQRDTIVCRCEDVTLAQVLPYESSRAAKLHTRCGMGPCQGRICGPALRFLCDWPPDSVRPPVFAARLESLVAAAPEPGSDG